MKRFLFIAMVLSLAADSGCCWVGCVTKRRNEQCCPTDIRKMHTWCWGEDAIFHAPCGPSEEFYGARPTVWRQWPTSGANWRDLYGNTSPMTSAVIPVETIQTSPTPTVAPPANSPTQSTLPPAPTSAQPILNMPPMDSASAPVSPSPFGALPESTIGPRPAQFLFPEFGAKSEFEK